MSSKSSSGSGPEGSTGREAKGEREREVKVEDDPNVGPDVNLEVLVRDLRRGLLELASKSSSASGPRCSTSRGTGGEEAKGEVDEDAPNLGAGVVIRERRRLVELALVRGLREGWREAPGEAEEERDGGPTKCSISLAPFS